MKPQLALALVPEPNDNEAETGDDVVRLTGETARRAEQANLHALDAAIEASGWLRS